MTFNHNKEIDLDKLLDNYYYYLPKRMDLQQLIIRRVENNPISDDLYTITQNITY